MATLYEIDAAIMSCVDSDTGEVLDVERLEALQMERARKIESVALWYKNLCSDAEQYSAEKKVFAEREAEAKKKAESLKKWLEAALCGNKMSTSRVAITFRKSKAVEIEDEAAFLEYAQREDMDYLLSYKAPTISKTAVKEAIESGKEIKGASIVERNNIQIK